MKSEQKKNGTAAQSGGVMVYILLALALLGALTMTLSRQNEQSDAQNIDDELVEFQVTRLLNYAQSAQSVVDQMIMSGSNTSDLVFDLPNSASFDTAPYIHKVYHPEGGGLISGKADPEIFTGTDNDPDPGWYMGLFNNVEWTPSATQDIILTAHQISKPACENINLKVTGTTTIPAIAGTGVLADYLIDDSLHTGTNADFTAVVCASCDGIAGLCVSNAAADMWSYFIVIEGQ
ncbi:MAG: hypothetical protein H6853_01095 [Rhodospirillales bacterium]|nr:hypothetical protein [Alphaproteobacteria bacterium]USO03909.1 MAG: hypothetical protein H6853_01095 [Rhodospirillales bacterium]